MPPSIALPLRRAVVAIFLSAASASPSLAQQNSSVSTEASLMHAVPIPPQAPAKEGVAALPGGARLYYRDTGGNGPAVVFLHPATGSALMWPYQQPVFAAAGYRVVAYSRRGYFGSDPVDKASPGSAAGDLDELVAFLRIARFHAVASAAGGSVATDYALSHPHKLISMVLSSSVGGVQDKDYLKLSESLRPDGFDAMPADFREIGPSYRAANPQGVRAWLDLENKALNGNRFGPKPLNAVTWQALATMRVPTLLMTGDADLWLPPSILRMFATKIPVNEMAIVPEVGHAIYWEAPETFNRLVLDFIGRHTP
jgi:pimeloyl-ACP methyl ester carboxylesterase